MAILFDILFLVGVVTFIVGWIWLLIKAFGESIECGLLSLFIPFYGVYYAVTRWPETKRPTLTYVIGFGIAFIIYLPLLIGPFFIQSGKSTSRESTVKKITITELKNMGSDAEGKYFLVIGKVLEGSVIRAEDGFSMNFTIEESGKKLGVIYRGIIPDTFREGRDVLLDGRYIEGRFEASTIFTKFERR